MTADTLDAHPRPDLTDVMRRVISLVTRNFKGLVIPAVLLVCLPALVVGLGELGHTWPVSVMGVIASLLCGCAFDVYAITTYAGDLDRSPVAAQEAWAIARRLWLPLAGLFIFYGFAVLVGFVLLIVPGVIVMLMWSVSSPVLVLEGTDISSALKRSEVLTKGRRWRLLLIYLTFAIIIGFAEAVALFWPHVLKHAFPALMTVCGAVVTGAVHLVSPAIATAVYKDLALEN